MPLDFEPRQGSAIDQASGIVIYAPRTLPASPPEDPDHTEYQYAFYRNDKRIDGLGLFGFDSNIEKAGRRERVFTLDLGRDWVLDSVFSFKETLGNEDDDFTFLQGLARGLVAVYENRLRVGYDLRYVVVTKRTLLAQRGIEVPNGAAQGAGDEIVLAEVSVPARPSSSAAS